MTAERLRKRERLIFRVTPLDRRLIEEAASTRGMSIGAFIRKATLDAATQALRGRGRNSKHAEMSR